MESLGPPHNDDNEFKARARLHQSEYRVKALKLKGYNMYGNRLTEKAAGVGYNFYLDFDGLFTEVKKRFKYKYSPLFYDMLRSEHIPFNFFVPLKLQKNKQLVKDILNIYLEGTIHKIDMILIEYAPTPKAVYLDDNTSFDVYIEYSHIDGGRGAIGIEVKYSEQDYPFGKTEKERMHNSTSVYNRLSIESGLYREGTPHKLRTRRFKQLWRNQLLGEAILRNPVRDLSHFTFLLFFPFGNKHFVNTSSRYVDFLVQRENWIKFKPVLFEDFIAIAQSYTNSDEHLKWLIYLQNRYIVKERDILKSRGSLTLQEIEKVCVEISRRKFHELAGDERRGFGRIFAKLAMKIFCSEAIFCNWKEFERNELTVVASQAKDIFFTNQLSDDKYLDKVGEEIREKISNSFIVVELNELDVIMEEKELKRKEELREAFMLFFNKFFLKRKPDNLWKFKREFYECLYFYFRLRARVMKRAQLSGHALVRLSKYDDKFLKDFGLFYEFYCENPPYDPFAPLNPNEISHYDCESRFLSDFITYLEEKELIHPNKPLTILEHAPDYSWVIYENTKYVFNPNQARIIAHLHEKFKEGVHEIYQKKLLGECNLPGSRLREYFRNSPAWGELIVKSRQRRQGVYRLPL